MRVPLSWLRELGVIPADAGPDEVSAACVKAGLEVENIFHIGVVTGDLVLGKVLAFVAEPQKNGKIIRWCRVDVGGHGLNSVPSAPGQDERSRGIVCGAANFAAGDLVVVALDGAVLPTIDGAGFTIAVRKTYGHLSDGMICSERELGIGDDHNGIMVIDPAEAATAGVGVGDDMRPLLGIPDVVVELAVTPDRGYCLSMRGVARELATGFGLPFTDPAMLSPALSFAGNAHARPCRIDDVNIADRFVLATLINFDPTRPSPPWLRRRLTMCGMRSVSLAVDITNLVMLELGQPLHAFDADQVQGTLVARRAQPGEVLVTLDHVERILDGGDVVIADDAAALALGGTMGGLHSEISLATETILLEAVHFLAVPVARQARRHKLSTEASRRFERGVDPALPPLAAARAAQLLVALGGARIVGATTVDMPRATSTIDIDVTLPGTIAGREYAGDVVRGRLVDVGCKVAELGHGRIRVTAPSWRPDLTDPYDLVEEVIRLEGYDTVPSELPRVPLSAEMSLPPRHEVRATVVLAAAGFVEVKSPPFVDAAVWDHLGIDASDRRRTMTRVANPMVDSQPWLRTSLLPGLLAALRRNVARGASDLALFEVGRVFWPKPGRPVRAPRLGVDRRPTDAELASLEADLPTQPRMLAVALSGRTEQQGWWGAGRVADWSDAIEAARLVADAIDATISVRAAEMAPWHPGRCAEIVLHQYTHSSVAPESVVIGYAGELHPRVCAALELPARTCVAEFDFDALVSGLKPPDRGQPLSTFPVATQDVALVVDDHVPTAAVESALREGAGELLESLRLFDVYTGEQVGAGRASLAYAMRFRANDRTLTAAETTAARDAAVARAHELTGAVLRS